MKHIPFALIILVVAYEIFGMAVNHISTNRQTKEVEKVLMEELSSVELIDSYTETGNTSGTGNHVDMLSVVVFKTDEKLLDIQNKLNKHYEKDDWGFWIEEMAHIKERYEEDGYLYSYCEELNLPKQLDNCYLVYLNKSAPFSDNIEGH